MNGEKKLFHEHATIWRVGDELHITKGKSTYLMHVRDKIIELKGQTHRSPRGENQFGSTPSSDPSCRVSMKLGLRAEKREPCSN